MRRRSYTLKIASNIKENLLFLKPVLGNKTLNILYFEECFRETLTVFSSSGLTYHDLQSCYQKRTSFAEFLLDFSKTSLS